MNRSLYFIPLIEKAMGAPNPRKALIKAFQEIKSRGADPEYADGFTRFSSFMSEVAENWKLQSHLPGDIAASLIDDLALQIAAENVDRPLFERETDTDRADLPKGLLELIEKRMRELSLSDIEHPLMELDITLNGNTVATICLDTREPRHRVSDVQPGAYTFSLGSGRVLWEVALGEKDLLLTRAVPGKNLRLAADTCEEGQMAPTREMAVLGGDLVFRVFAGLESGWIEIDAKDHR